MANKKQSKKGTWGYWQVQVKNGSQYDTSGPVLECGKQAFITARQSYLLALIMEGKKFRIKQVDKPEHFL